MGLTCPPLGIMFIVLLFLIIMFVFQDVNVPPDAYEIEKYLTLSVDKAPSK